MEPIKVYLAILNTGWIRRELFPIVHDWFKTEGIKLEMEHPNKSVGHPISSNRNEIVQRFLKTDNEYLLMLDNDIIPLGNPLFYARARKHIIGFPAKVRARSMWTNWVAYSKVPDAISPLEAWSPVDMTVVEPEIELLQVDIVGTGCILIGREVLENLKAPFNCDYNEDGVLITGTDFGFCIKAGKAGYEVFTTPKLLCDHIKEASLLNCVHYSDVDDCDQNKAKYEIPWSEFTISPAEWNFIKRIILENKIENVIEFGSGLSTCLISNHCNIHSYEESKEYRDEVNRQTGDIGISRLWEKNLWEPVMKYDMAFIDGPKGGDRVCSYEMAIRHSPKHIICHDGLRDWDLQEKYLSKDYKLTRRSGYYQSACHYWKRKD